MPFQDQALNSLRSLQSTSNAARSIPMRRRQEDILDEMRRNLYLEGQRPGLTFSGATPVDIEKAQSDLGDSPNFGNEAVARLKDYENSQYDANKAGFENPQASAAYGRSMEEQKMNMPIREAEVTGGYDLQKQAQADKARQQLQDTDPQGGYFKQLGDVLGGGSLGDRAITHVGPGGVSFATPQKPSAGSTVSNALVAARRAYAANPSPGLQAQIDILEKQLGVPPAQESPGLLDILSGGMFGSKEDASVDPAEVASFAEQYILNDPEVMTWPLERIRRGFDPSMTPAFAEQLLKVISQARGGW